MLLKEQTLLLRLPLMGKKKVAGKLNFPQQHVSSQLHDVYPSTLKHPGI